LNLQIFNKEVMGTFFTVVTSYMTGTIGKSMSANFLPANLWRISGAAKNSCGNPRETGADFIEAAQLIFSEVNRQRRQVIIELSASARSENGNESLGSDPSDGDLARRSICFFCDSQQLVQYGRFLFRVLVMYDPPKFGRTPLLALPVFAGQQPAAERRPSAFGSLKLLAV